MKILTNRISRVLLSIPIVMFGLMHFTNTSQMAGMLSGWPMAKFLVLLTGVLLVAAGICIHTKKLGYIAGIGLGAMLIIFALGIHLPGVINAASEQAMMTSMSGLLKDLGLAGGAFMAAQIAKADS